MVQHFRYTRALVLPIVLLAIAAALYRVYTAPERIEERLKTAQSVCEKSGGQWLTDADGRPICQRN